MDELAKILDEQIEVKYLTYSIESRKDGKAEVVMTTLERTVKIPPTSFGDELTGKVVDTLMALKQYERFKIKQMAKQK